MPMEVAFSDEITECNSPTQLVRQRHINSQPFDLQPSPSEQPVNPRFSTNDTTTFQAQLSHESVDHDFELIQHPENLVEALRQVNNYTVRNSMGLKIIELPVKCFDLDYYI